MCGFHLCMESWLILVLYPLWHSCLQKKLAFSRQFEYMRCWARIILIYCLMTGNNMQICSLLNSLFGSYSKVFSVYLAVIFSGLQSVTFQFVNWHVVSNSISCFLVLWWICCDFNCTMLSLKYLVSHYDFGSVLWFTVICTVVSVWSLNTRHDIVKSRS